MLEMMSFAPSWPQAPSGCHDSIIVPPTRSVGMNAKRNIIGLITGQPHFFELVAEIKGSIDHGGARADSVVELV